MRDRVCVGDGAPTCSLRRKGRRDCSISLDGHRLAAFWGILGCNGIYLSVQKLII